MLRTRIIAAFKSSPQKVSSCERGVPAEKGRDSFRSLLTSPSVLKVSSTWSILTSTGCRCSRARADSKEPGGSTAKGRANFPRRWGSPSAGRTGRIYVSEFYNHRVQIFSEEGKLLGNWGGDGGTEGKVHYPDKLTVAPDGNVFVADTHNERIQKFDPQGGFLEQFTSSGAGGFQDPTDVAVDLKGRMHVTDSGTFRLIMLGPKGEFLTEWRLPETHEARFQSPVGVAIDQQGYLYVSDLAENRLVKLEVVEN